MRANGHSPDVAPGAAADLVGIVAAVVRDQLARLRVAEVGVVTEVFPHASGGDKHNYECTVRLRDTGLELQRVPVATPRIGMAAIPDVDDLVLLSFVGGSIHGAVVTARLYNDVDRPPEAKAREWVYVSPHDTESGIRRLLLQLPNGNTVCLDDDKLEIQAGQTTVTVNNGGDVEVDSNADVVVKCAGNTEVNSQGDISLEAGGNVSVKAGADVKVEGLTLSLKGQTSTQVEGQASTTVKGATISVAGVTSFSPG